MPANQRRRSRAQVLPYVATTFVTWLRKQPRPRGEVYCVETGVLFRETSNTPEATESTTLAAEILSGTDTQMRIIQAIKDHLAAGAASVWIINPHDQTVTVYRSNEKPVMFNDAERISEIARMPGFSPRVAELFE